MVEANSNLCSETHDSDGGYIKIWWFVLEKAVAIKVGLPRLAHFEVLAQIARCGMSNAYRILRAMDQNWDRGSH
jgi:hypothetical protein